MSKNISFSISDNATAVKFIDAAKWKLKDSKLADKKAIDKCLKQYMGQLIDEYALWLEVGADEAALNALKATVNAEHSQLYSLNRQMMDAEMALQQKKAGVKIVPVVVDDEG